MEEQWQKNRSFAKLTEPPQKPSFALPTKNLDGSVVFGSKRKAPMGPSNGTDQASDEDADVAETTTTPLFSEAAYEAVADVELEDLAGSGSSEPDEAFVEAQPASSRKAKAKAKAKAAKAAAAAAAEQLPPDSEDDGQPATDRDLLTYQSQQERVEALKVQMAVASSQLMQDPQAHVRNLHALLTLARDTDREVARLAMLSLQTVFADILPEYCIRLPTAKELGAPVSKDVKALRDFESTLLRQSEAYVKVLHKWGEGLRGADGGDVAMALVAHHCMHGLLAARPGFNFSSQLLQSIIPTLAHQQPEAAAAARSAVRRVIAADTGGEVTLQAVQLIADLVKRADCGCDPEVIKCLWGIEFRDAKLPETARKKGGKAQKKKQKKTQRSITGEVLNVFAESDAAAATKAATERKSLTLEALFEILFRIVKTAAAAAKGGGSGGRSKGRRGQDRTCMLGAALEGIRKFGHLISLDYFSDLNTLLIELLQGGRLSQVLQCECLCTGIQINRLQAGELVDQLSFFDHLVKALENAAVLPLQLDGAKCLTPVAATAASGQLSQHARHGPLLLEAAQAMLTGHSTQITASKMRTAVKALTLGAVDASDSGCAMGLLSLTGQLLGRHLNLSTLLEHESCAPSSNHHHESQQDLFAASASSEVLWELVALRHHYHPDIAATARSIATAGERRHWGSAVTAALEYSSASGCFKPPPQRSPVVSRGPRGTARAAARGITSEGPLAAAAAAGDDGEDGEIEDKLRKVVRRHFECCRHQRPRELATLQQAQLAALQLSELRQETCIDAA